MPLPAFVQWAVRVIGPYIPQAISWISTNGATMLHMAVSFCITRMNMDHALRYLLLLASLYLVLTLTMVSPREAESEGDGHLVLAVLKTLLGGLLTIPLVLGVYHITIQRPVPPKKVEPTPWQEVFALPSPPPPPPPIATDGGTSSGWMWKAVGAGVAVSGAAALMGVLFPPIAPICGTVAAVALL